jgi:hypothetical protein
MLTDPQAIAYATVSKNLPAVSRGPSNSEYRLADTGGVIYDLITSHQFKKRNRVVVRLSRTSYSTDPLVPAQNIVAGMTATFTLDFPTVGLLPADAVDIGKALVDYLGTSGLLLKLANGET